MALALLSIAAAGQAGTVTTSAKDTKATEPAPPATCFKDQELQLDAFGAYVDGNALDHAGPWQDHGFGGGIGLNYFFSRYIGVGIEGTAIYGRENRQHDDRGNQLAEPKHTPIYSANGSVIFRLPIDRLCLAPYAYLGGGVSLDGDEWATGFAGIGVEYRIVPQKVGLFVDGRWTYYGDRYGNGDQNNFLAKVGVRLIF